MSDFKVGMITIIVGAIILVTIVIQCNKDYNKEPSPDSTGYWEIREFVDNFGDKTGRKYINQYFSGTFSEPGVRNERAYIQFFISGSERVQVELHQYSQTDSTWFSGLTGTLQDSDGNRYSIKLKGGGRNNPRNTFDANSSKIIHDALMKGDEVKIRLTEDGNHSNYAFDLPQMFVKGYSNAYNKIIGN